MSTNGRRVVHHLHEIINCPNAIHAASLDHTHQQVAHRRALFSAEEEGVLTMQHHAFQRPLDRIGIQRCIP